MNPLKIPSRLRKEIRLLNGPNPLPIERRLVSVLGTLNGRVKAKQGLTASDTKTVRDFFIQWGVSTNEDSLKLIERRACVDTGCTLEETKRLQDFVMRGAV